MRLQIPFMAPRLFVMNPDLAKKLYMESGAQPMRGGFEALTKVRRENAFFENNLGLLKHLIKEASEYSYEI